MLPIPTHLEGVLIPTGHKNDELFVDGAMRCNCGHEHFRVKIFADAGKWYLQAREYHDDYALVVRAVCEECGKDLVVFDESQHGWNGFVCHDGTTVPDEALTMWNCPKCGGGSHRVRVSIRSQGKQDFIEETGIADGEMDFREQDWVDGFSWISVGLKCVGCGHDDEGWVDCETA